MIPTQYTVDTPYMVGPVHCYTIELHGELVLFDTGPPTDTGVQFLKSHIDLERLRHVIITHCHIDHYGQSYWLEKNSSTSIYIPYRDIQKVRRHEERMEKMLDLLAGMGFGGDCLESVHESFYRNVIFPPFPDKYLVAEHDIPGTLDIEILGCAGHSQSDLVYTGDNWAITGDTLLRGIYQSPLLDIDLETGARFNNYQAYCRTLLNLAKLRDKTILPGHRQRVESVDATIHFYISKTLYRTLLLQPHLRDYSVAQVIDRVFCKQMTDPFHIYLKASEIMFMKDLLENPETLRTALAQIGLFEKVKDNFERLFS